MNPGRLPAGGDDAVDRAARLIAIFCPSPSLFGTVVAAEPGDVPDVDRQLLDHRSHMTVAMERHHGCRVGVRVVAARDGRPEAEGRYAREIVLVRPDGRIVQYGVVRIDLDVVEPRVAAAIRAAEIPLGRILVDAGLLCDVQHVRLLRIDPGPHLRGILPDTGPLSGRVAEILVGGRPAIELLEVVVPS